MPEIGDVIRRQNRKLIWTGCAVCGRERWVQVRNDDQPAYLRCQKCAANSEEFLESHRGAKHPKWKGGRKKSGDGYILILIRPEDFFYPMATCVGYVLEHRLVVARNLGRTLFPWEVVHHKNGIRDDNRIENLELLSSRKEHAPDTMLRCRLQLLEQKVEAQSKFIDLLLRQLVTMK